MIRTLHLLFPQLERAGSRKSCQVTISVLGLSTILHIVSRSQVNPSNKFGWRFQKASRLTKGENPNHKKSRGFFNLPEKYPVKAGSVDPLPRREAGLDPSLRNDKHKASYLHELQGGFQAKRVI
jgi:hypothetical protein